MGSNSPSRFRREGQNAFAPGCDPADLCPYKIGDWGGRHSYWVAGWKKAERAHEAEVAEQKAEDDEFTAFKYSCPWNQGEGCEAVQTGCFKENCAPWYFKNL